jgi:hypothetical protein
VENINSWAHAVAPHLWAIVEVLGSKGVIDNTGPSKMNEFMKRLEAETEAVHGEKLPSQAAAAAKLVAEGLSAADHLLDPQEASDGEMD